MSKLKVLFDDLQHGWVTLAIHDGDEAIAFQTCYIYNSSHLMTDALLTLKLSEGKTVAKWQCEPTEDEICFLGRDKGKMAKHLPNPRNGETDRPVRQIELDTCKETRRRCRK